MGKIERPALGTLKVGDKVIVIEPMHRQPNREYDGIVTKVARVWITVEHEYGMYPREARFRLDTQDDGNGSTYRWRFVTPEQRAWDGLLAGARAVLADAGVEIARWTTSGWNAPGGILKLAELIKSVSAEEIKSWSE